MRLIIGVLLLVSAASQVPPPPPPRFAPSEFRDVRMMMANGDKTKEVDVIFRFGEQKMQLINTKVRQSYKDLAYADCKSAEYSYSKSPRWKSGLLVSPFLFLSSGKKHWFMVQGNDDYALVQLDKSNYKLILAAVEAKSGKKVDTVADSK